MKDDRLAGRIVSVAEYLVCAAVTKGLTDTRTELVLNMIKDRQGHCKCYYYFVDHANHCLFWHVDVEVEDLFGLFPGITQKSQISTLDKWLPFSS